MVLLDSLKLGVSLLQYLPVCSEATEFLKIHKKGSFIVKGESGRAGFCYCILKYEYYKYHSGITGAELFSMYYVRFLLDLVTFTAW